jgi:hypothetical protein
MTDNLDIGTEEQPMAWQLRYLGTGTEEQPMTWQIPRYWYRGTTNGMADT